MPGGGSVEIRITGAEDLRALADRLKRYAAGHEVDRRLAKALQDAGRPAVKAARASAERILPARGGLAAIVAQQPMPVTAVTSGRYRGIRIQARPGRGKAGVNDPAAINRGRVRHPAWGHERKDGQPIIQLVKPGWFATPMAQQGPEVRDRLVKAIGEIIADLEA